MTIRRGYKHQITIDGQTVWLDSRNEAIALERFINDFGFSGKWARPEFGIKYAGKFYSPDFELAVEYNGRTARGLIEVKQYRRDFTDSIAKRMRVVARHYHTDCLYLYTTKSNRWYAVSGSSVARCTPPRPGSLPLGSLMSPPRRVVSNYYGRHYYQSFGDTMLSFARRLLVPSPKKRRKKY